MPDGAGCRDAAPGAAAGRVRHLVSGCRSAGLVGALGVILVGPAGALTSLRGYQAADVCPYNFQSPMPRGTFCVYRGRPRDARGQDCGAEAVVIWRSGLDAAARQPAPRRVFVGFVEPPALVLHAVAEDRRQARVVGGRGAPQRAAVPLDGETTLLTAPGGRHALSVELSDPLRWPGDGAPCAIRSFRGEFVGVISGAPRLPSVSP
ncbi:MAG: hypothetical protein SF182_19760 [Deltaproteobacteria bacterium]|nr:hypothetical protein [Deltaproteobacteria bacterium]